MEDTNGQFEFLDPFEVIDNLDLSTFCLKQSFELVFMAPASPKDASFSESLNESAIKFDQGNVKFIGFEDLETMVQKDWDNFGIKDINFPTYLVPVVKSISSGMKDFLDDFEANLRLTAYAIKLLIIEKMYGEYKKEVLRIQRREKLEEELLQLSKTTAAQRRNQAKQKKSEKTGKNRVFREPDHDLEVLEDYTTFIIEENNDFLIKDSSLMQKLSFYIVTGFFSVSLLQELIIIGLPINVVLEISGVTISDNVNPKITLEMLKDFWENLNTSFFSYQRLSIFERTFLMKHNITHSDPKAILKDFLNLLYSIVDFKLNHLEYLRNLNVQRIPNARKIDAACLKIYNEVLKDIPSDLFTNNEGIILDGLLKEVCFHFGEFHCPIETPKNVFTESDAKCPNFGFDELFENRKLKSKKEVNKIFSAQKIANRFPTSENIFQGFVVNKRDKLSLILHCYKNVGSLFYDININVLIAANPILKSTEFTFETDNEGIKHLHNRCQSIDSIRPPPIVYENEEDDDVYDDNVILINTSLHNEIIDHFINIFLLSICREEESKSDNLEADNGILDHLRTFPINSLEEECVKVKSSWEDEFELEVEKAKKVEFLSSNVNNYNAFPLFYLWKEKLNSDVLLQELSSVQRRYLYCDRIYSPSTQKLLLSFHDNLDKYGCHVKTHYELINHPMCLRDFCYFAVSKMGLDLKDWTLDARIDSNERLNKNICPGLSNIINNPFYQEYYHLLDIGDEILPEKSQVSIEGNNYLTDLNEYNQNKDLSDLYGSTGINQCFEMKTNELIYLFGKSTIFSSFDSVKLTLDTTRFVHEKPKCAATFLLYNNHQLTLYSSEEMSKDPYYFHFCLEDGTIVLFCHKNQRKPESLDEDLVVEEEEKIEEAEKESETVENEETVEDDSKNDSKDHSKNESKNDLKEESKNDLKEDSKDDSKDSKEDLKEDSKEDLEEDLKVPAVDVDTFLKSNKSLSVEDIVIQDDKDKLLETLLKSKNIYKINPRYKYLQPKMKTSVPLWILMHRLISKNQLNPEQIPKKFEFTSKDKEFYNYCPEHTLDVTIMYPSGLKVTTVLSQTTSRALEIKQKYVGEKTGNLDKVQNEDYRLFTRGGQCVIKYLDGSMSFLHSNGDIIKFHRPSYPFKGSKSSCHKNDLNYYRKTLNNIFQSRQNRRKSSNCVSRKTGFSSIKAQIPESFQGNLKSYNLPYEKVSILKFDGSRIRSDFSKLRWKRKFTSHLERDFNPFQFIYIRSDGFKSYKNEFGLYQVEYPDSTRIMMEVGESDEMVCGFVFVTISYTFLHPFYATVLYDFKGTLKVHLNNDMAIFCEELTSFKLRIDHNITAIITRDLVNVYQSCPDCESACHCKISTENFSLNQWKPEDNFIKITDSYNKEFTCNFIGECTRNQTYLTSLKNIRNCCHYLKTNYKRIFVIDSNLSGELLLSEDYIEQKKGRFLRDKAAYIEEGTDDQERYTMTFGRYLYKTYCNRYFDIDLLKTHIGLQRNLNWREKYKPNPKSVCYKTTSVFLQVMDSEDLMSFVCYIKNFHKRMGQLEGDQLDYLRKAVGRFCSDLIAYKKSIIQSMQSTYVSGSMNASNKSKSAPRDSNVKVCHCEKSTYSVYEKMAKWKEEYIRAAQKLKNIQVPKYFDSPYFYRFYRSE